VVQEAVVGNPNHIPRIGTVTRERIGVRGSSAHVATHPAAGRRAGGVTARRSRDVGADGQALHAIGLGGRAGRDTARRLDKQIKRGSRYVGVDEIVVAADAADGKASAVGEEPKDIQRVVSSLEHLHLQQGLEETSNESRECGARQQSKCRGLRQLRSSR
jgi:hypothetical protein